MIQDYYMLFTAWLNENQGVLGLFLFCITLVLGWVSGIFSALRRRPKFRVSTIDGPTYCCTYSLGTMRDGFELHRTGVVLYLSIANVGSSASSIGRISVGYHWNLRPFTFLWLRHSLGWFWLTNQAVALEDFKVSIGDKIKYYPFLIQQSAVSSSQVNTYLEVGCAVNGVVYFEQNDSWGGCFPRVQKGKVRLKVKVQDVFGRSHTQKVWVPSVTLEEARGYNFSFGRTFEAVRSEL